VLGILPYSQWVHCIADNKPSVKTGEAIWKNRRSGIIETRHTLDSYKRRVAPPQPPNRCERLLYAGNLWGPKDCKWVDHGR
jgi:hypothetical protein